MGYFWVIIFSDDRLQFDRCPGITPPERLDEVGNRFHFSRTKHNRPLVRRLQFAFGKDLRSGPTVNGAESKLAAMAPAVIFARPVTAGWSASVIPVRPENILFSSLQLFCC